jgi:hypothetical protein
MIASKSRAAWSAATVIAFMAAIAQSSEVRGAGLESLHDRDAAPQAPAGSPNLNYIENWDGYAAGSNVLGQGGWEGFFGDAEVGAFIDDALSSSPANSIEIAGASDLVHRFAIPSGVWVLRAKQYIPGDFAGSSYFNVFKIYQEPWWFCQWSVQVHFDSETGTLINDGFSGGVLPYVTGEWADIEISIDLENDTQTFRYNGAELYTGTWTEEMLSFPGGLRIGAIEMYANGASPVYYDDISLSGSVTYAVNLDAATATIYAEPGTTVAYMLTATNTGNFDDVYDIAAGAGAWTANASLSEISLAVGESATFEVTVEIPADAARGDSDFTIPSVTSRGRNETGDSIALTTTVGDTVFVDGFDS